MDEQNINNNQENSMPNIEPEAVNTMQTEQGTPQYDFESQSASGDAYAYNPYRPVMPTVAVTPMDAPNPEKKKGLLIFALIMAAVVLLCGSLAIGYNIGRNNGDSGKSFIEVDLSAKPADTDMMTAAQVYKKVNNSIVGITIYNNEYMANASGIVYSEDGYIITNDHIYDGIAAAKFKIHTSDGATYSAKYIAGDTRSDMAVLKITDKVKLQPAELGNPDELVIGEPVVAVGRPTGAETANNLTAGYVSALGRRSSATSSYTMRFIQTDTAINPGNSGGALINMYGQVVGVVSYKLASTEYEGMGYAVPMDITKSVADSLIKNGYVEGRARLGISYSEINSVTAEVYDMDIGLYIASVDADSELYGKVSEGDIITEVNDKKITGADIMLDVIESSKPGDSLTFTVVSEGETKSIKAKLLADKGSSSYSQNKNNGNEGNNTEEFDFPFGE